MGNAIGKAFVEHYYTLFDSNRLQLSDLYQDTSMICFENERYAGKKQIMGKLCNGVFFKKVQHIPKTLDVQPSGCNGIMVMCTGELKVDEEVNTDKCFIYCLQTTRCNAFGCTMTFSD